MRLTFVVVAFASLLGIAGPANPLWSLFESLWPPAAVSVRGIEKEGAGVDPDGLIAPADAGCGADPDGLTAPADAGAGWDPNG